MQKIFKAVLRDIYFNKSRSGITLFALFIVIAVPIAMLSTGPSLDHSIAQNNEDYHLAHIDIRFPAVLPNVMGEINDTIFDTLGVYPEAITARLLGSVKLHNHEDWYLPRILSYNSSEPLTINQLKLVEGTQEIDEQEVLLLDSFANHLNVSVGDNITLFYADRNATFTVVGLVEAIESLSYELSQEGVIFMEETSIRSLTHFPIPYINNILIYLSDGVTSEEIHECTDNLQTMFLNQSISYSVQLDFRENGLNAALLDALDLSTNYLVRGAILIIIIVGIVVYIITKRYAVEQRKQTGMLYSFGFSSSSILKAFLLRTLLLCLFAIVLGVFCSWYLLGFFSQLLGSRWGVIAIYPQLSWVLVLEIASSTFVTSLLFTFIGAFENVSMTPYEAIRGKSKEFQMHTDRFFSKIFTVILSILPLQSKMAFRNIIRNKGRSIFTVVAFSCSILLSFSLMTVQSNLVNTQDAYYDRITWDVKVAFNPTQNVTETESTILALPTVNQSDIYLEWYIQPFNQTNKIVFLRGISDESIFFDLDLQSGDYFSASASSEVILSQYLADRLGYQIGDAFDFRVFDQLYNLTVIGFCRDMENPLAVYVQLSTLEAQLGYNPYNGIMLTTTGEDLTGLEATLNTLPGVNYAYGMQVLKNRMGNIIESQTLIVKFMAGLGLIISFLSIFSTTTIIILERNREYALERIFGFTPAEIFSQLFNELFLIAIVSLTLGFIGGWYYAARLRSLLSSAFFQVDSFRQLGLYFLQVGFALLSVLASLLPQLQPLRQKYLAENVLED